MYLFVVNISGRLESVSKGDCLRSSGGLAICNCWDKRVVFRLGWVSWGWVRNVAELAHLVRVVVVGLVGNSDLALGVEDATA